MCLKTDSEAAAASVAVEDFLQLPEGKGTLEPSCGPSRPLVSHWGAWCVPACGHGLRVGREGLGCRRKLGQRLVAPAPGLLQTDTWEVGDKQRASLSEETSKARLAHILLALLEKSEAWFPGHQAAWLSKLSVSAQPAVSVVSDTMLPTDARLRWAHLRGRAAGKREALVATENES